MLLAELVPNAECWFHFRYLSRDPLKDCKSIMSRLGMVAILPIVREGIFRPGQLILVYIAFTLAGLLWFI